MPNPRYEYHSHMIIKVWEAYLRQKNLKFYIKPGRVLDKLFSETFSMSLSIQAALILNENSIYRTQRGESISVVDEVNHVNHTAIAGLNSVIDSLDLAIQQLISWNQQSEDKIIDHRVIFPYQVSAGHWNLGVLKLKMHGTSIHQANMHFYEPMNPRMVLNKNKRKQFSDFINTYTNSAIELEFIFKCTYQQNDGSSCGAISAENGKDFIDDTDSRIGKKYEAGAENLRQAHIDEVNDPAFDNIQKDGLPIFKKTGESETHTINYKDLLQDLAKLNNDIKVSLKNAINSFIINYNKVSEGETILEPFERLKDFFKKHYLKKNDKDTQDDKIKNKTTPPEVLKKLFSLLFKDNSLAWQDGAIDFVANDSLKIIHALCEKQASNPFSTGGGGENYEGKVRAYFVYKLLTNEFVPEINISNIERVHFQARDQGYQTDDIVVTCNENSNTVTLPIQVKRTINFVATDGGDLSDSILQFWLDYNNPNRFNHGTDSFILIFEKADQAEVDVSREMLTKMRSSADSQEYLNTYRKQTSKEPEKKKHKKKDTFDFFQLVKNILDKIENNIPDEALWDFMRKIYLVKIDFSVELANIYSRLRQTTHLSQDSEVINLWSRIVTICADYSQRAGTITKENLPSDVTNAFKSKEKNQDLTGLDCFGSSKFPSIHNIDFTSNYFSNITECFKKSRTVALWGIQGAGKTYLALHYMARAKELFSDTTCRIYLSASDSDRLDQQYLELGKAGGLPLASYTPKEATKKVTEWLNNKIGVFLFFDGAKNKKEINRFIPNSQGRVLVTTTSKTAYKPNAVEIKIMSEEEAIKLVRTELIDLPEQPTDPELHGFVTMLGCLPLAMVQACAYINQHDCSVPDYCNFYETKKKEALEDETRYLEHEDHEPVYITWDLSFAEINKLNPQAANILISLAYFQISDIDRLFVNKFFNLNDTASVDLLVNYCLLERTKDNLILHTVLKDVIIEQQKEKNKHQNELKDLLIKCQNIFIFRHHSNAEAMKMLQITLPHVESILSFAKDEKTDLQPFQDLILAVARYYLDVFNNTDKATKYLTLLDNENGQHLHAALKTKTDYLKSKIKLRQNKAQEAYNLLQPYIADRTQLNIYELCHLAQVLLRLKPTIQYPQLFFNANNNQGVISSQIPSQEKKQDNIEEAEKILLDSLILVETEMNDHHEHAMVLHYLGNYQLFYKRNVDKALGHYKEALRIKNLFTNDAREVARTLQQIGFCFFKQKRYSEALDTFREAHDKNKGSLFASEILSTLNKLVITIYKVGMQQKDRAIYLNEMLITLYEIKNLKSNLGNNYDKVCYLIAQTYLNLERKEDAEDALKEVKNETLEIKELKAVLQSGDIQALFEQANEKLGAALKEHEREELSEEPEVDIEDALNDELSNVQATPIVGASALNNSLRLSH